MNLRKVLYYLVFFVSVILIVASALSLFSDLPYWYSKLLDFPRLQYLVVGIVLLPLFIVLVRKWNWPAILVACGLAAAIAIQSVRIFPYWFGDKSVPDVAESYSEESSLSIMLANVLITNKESANFLNVVRDANPDMVLAMEVNQWWLDELEGLKKDYPYFMEQPNDVAYGMALYSKYELKNKQLKYLKHKNVPSFHVRVPLDSGKEIVLHAVHPVAPMPSDKYPDSVGEAEVALLKVGDFVAKEKTPSIVAGDFNDVSWSNTARLLGKDGNLRDVRLGRGLYNTFDANSKIMRWPLDHYFVTKEFKLADLRLLGDIGSDHFPIFAEFVLSE